MCPKKYGFTTHLLGLLVVVCWQNRTSICEVFSGSHIYINGSLIVISVATCFNYAHQKFAIWIKCLLFHSHDFGGSHWRHQICINTNMTYLLYKLHLKSLVSSIIFKVVKTMSRCVQTFDCWCVFPPRETCCLFFNITYDLLLKMTSCWPTRLCVCVANVMHRKKKSSPAWRERKQSRAWKWLKLERDAATRSLRSTKRLLQLDGAASGPLSATVDHGNQHFISMAAAVLHTHFAFRVPRTRHIIILTIMHR